VRENATLAGVEASSPRLKGRVGAICDEAPFLPAEWHGKEVLIFAACYSGDMAEGEKATRALRALGKPIASVSGYRHRS